MYMVLISFALINMYSTYIIARKFGYKGWEFFIPFYNFAIMMEIITGKKSTAFLLLLVLIPAVGPLIVGVLALIWSWKFAGKLCEFYQGKQWQFFLFGFILLPVCVMKDCPNCDDIISKKISLLFVSSSSPEESSTTSDNPETNMMAFKYCKYCGERILANSNYCPECGEKLTAN